MNGYFFFSVEYSSEWMSRPPRLSELNPIVFNMELTHLGSETSISKSSLKILNSNLQKERIFWYRRKNDLKILKSISSKQNNKITYN